MVGSVECEYCKKKFKSKRAKNQHVSMVHKINEKMAPPAVAKTGRTRGSLRLRRTRTSNLPGFDIAPSRVPTVRGGMINISGEDRIGAFDLKSGKAVFMSVDISPSMSARLTTIARAYQRIKWNAVKIVVTPQASAMTNGGYVCGFIADPSDRAVTASDLSASQGAQTKKFYETAVVYMPRKTDLLYTSAGEDPRLFMPASFWIISEGLPSSNLTMIVSVVWDVTLSQPTLENSHNNSFLLVGEIVPNPANYNLRYSPPGGDPQDDASSIIPAVLRETPGYHYFRVPTFTIEYSEGTGDTGTIQAHFVVYHTTDKKLYYSSNGRDVETTMWQGNVDAHQTLVPCGTFMKYVGQENSCRDTKLLTPKLLSETSPGSTSSSTNLSAKMQKLETLFLELKQNYQKDSKPLMEESMILKPNLVEKLEQLEL
ncbi:putative capsid protein [Hubei permutotetra-like virus 11]|uniref:putative capsid protein n=1 Tax=Hubei permutotetra-like virus 11 TaxID=1923075 RepID=UPI00090CB969|nr:putative capsid protein [Hubei permutotetra-like virus 11]APG76927.1 putative capsid protein [Hubei permutotetra-like virus 11]